MRNPFSFVTHLSRKQQLAGLGGLLAIAGIAIGFAVTSGGGTPPASTTTTTPTTTPPTTAALAANICPLTGLAAKGSQAPRRVALAVKIGNEPSGARPQAGLNEADIVFDTPAEGFIMRYMAVYQCNDASQIGPTRSVRWVDYHLARMFITPILAFAGGINPNVDNVFSSKWILPANLLTNAAAAGTRISSRVPPDNLYTNTSALWAMYKNHTTPPKPVFVYSSSIPASAAATSTVRIHFSAGTDAIWKWNPSGNDWLHSYSDTGSDIDTATNQQVSTTNVFVMTANYKLGPYSESPGGTGDIESVTQGDGHGYVLRDGKRIAVTWHRQNLIDGFTFTDAQGNPVDLAPGRTWVEIVPNTVADVKGNISFG